MGQNGYFLIENGASLAKNRPVTSFYIFCRTETQRCGKILSRCGKRPNSPEELDFL